MRIVDHLRNEFTSLKVLMLLALLLFVIGDTVTTYATLTYGNHVIEGNSNTGKLLFGYQSITGYEIMFVSKAMFFVSLLFVGIMVDYVFNGHDTGKWTAYGFILYGLYLSISNLLALFTGYPLIPQGINQVTVANYGDLILPIFMAVGVLMNVRKLKNQ